MDCEYVCEPNKIKELKNRVSCLEKILVISSDQEDGILEIRDLVNPSPREIKTFTEIMPVNGETITSVTKHWDYENLSNGQIFHCEPGRIYFMLRNPLKKYDEFVIYLSHQESNLRHERS